MRKHFPTVAEIDAQQIARAYVGEPSRDFGVWKRTQEIA